MGAKTMTRIKMSGVVVMVAVAVAALPGCLIGSQSRESQTGTQVSQQTFDQIEPGSTTRQWVLGTLGEPDKKTDIGGGEELWKWSYTKTKTSSGYFLFVFGGSSETSKSGAAYVQLKDDVVTKKWRTEE